MINIEILLISFSHRWCIHWYGKRAVAWRLTAEWVCPRRDDFWCTTCCRCHCSYCKSANNSDRPSYEYNVNWNAICWSRLEYILCILLIYAHLLRKALVQHKYNELIIIDIGSFCNVHDVFEKLDGLVSIGNDFQHSQIKKHSSTFIQMVRRESGPSR